MEIIALVIIFAAAGALGHFLGIASHDLRYSSDVDKLDDYSVYELPTEVYDIHGDKITEFIMKKREIVNFHEIPDSLVNALVSMEDRRFFKHNGYDGYAISRAAVKNLRALKVVEGGSTVTQQLAKLLFTDRKRSFSRKLIELYLAIQIEKRYSKQEILEKYFNRIYFDHSVYGVEMASQYFFGKEVTDLNIAESAMLVGIPPAPTRYSPFRIKNRKKSKNKLRLVLDRMIEMGFAKKEETDFFYRKFWQDLENRIIVKEPRSAIEDRIDKAPYFSEYIRQIVENDLKEKWYNELVREIKEEDPDISPDELEKNVEKRVRTLFFTGGYKIYTTLDLKQQYRARKILRSQLAHQEKVFKWQNRGLYKRVRNNYTDLMNFVGVSNLKSNYYFKVKQDLLHIEDQLEKEAEPMRFISGVFGIDKMDRLIRKYEENLEESNKKARPEGAIVCIEPDTGHIIAMVGGSKYTKRNQLNRVLSRRQPGSTFKPFVYGAAFQTKKIYPATTYDDTILRYRGWVVRSAIGKYKGAISVRNAVKDSVNSVAVQVGKEIGPETVIDFAAPMMNVDRKRFRSDMSIALGTTELTPLEMVTGISVYANSGRKVLPIAILKIKDRYGSTVKDYEQEQKRKLNDFEQSEAKGQIISKELAYLMTDILKDVVSDGTATIVKKLGFRYPAAGKTGTTQNNKDAWFIGYTPYYAAAVWVGFDKGGISLGRRQFGGNVAAPVWAKFMKGLHKGHKYKRFRNPGGLKTGTVCAVTGLIQSESCKLVHQSNSDYFLEGTFPEKVCEGHKVTEEETKEYFEAIQDKELQEALGLYGSALTPEADKKTNEESAEAANQELKKTPENSNNEKKNENTGKVEAIKKEPKKAEVKKDENNKNP